VQLPLNVSPVAASFFSLQRQGIHHVLCLACCLAYALLFVISSWRILLLQLVFGRLLLPIGKIEVILFLQLLVYYTPLFARRLHNMPYFFWLVKLFFSQVSQIGRNCWKKYQKGRVVWRAI
jgi:hypothetical protein